MTPSEFITIINIESKGRGIIASKHIRKGGVIFKFFGELVPRKKVKNPNAALQLDEELFLESDGTIDEGLNHSCNPNC
jgi:hypothetical protein